MKLQTYAQFRPTSFDARGLSLPDRQTWIVAPVSQDHGFGFPSQDFERSCEVAPIPRVRISEVHRFGHWGHGWFEIILVDPSRAAEVQAIADQIEDYPILNEEDYSAREYVAASDTWRASSLRDRIELCQRFRVSVFAARREEIPDDPAGLLIDHLARGY